MEASSSSTIAPVPISVDTKIKEVKHELKSLQTQVNVIEYEGGRRLDHVNKDLVFLRKKIKRKVKWTENSLTRQIIELELKVDKLPFKFVKHEENVKNSDKATHYWIAATSRAFFPRWVHDGLWLYRFLKGVSDVFCLCRSLKGIYGYSGFSVNWYSITASMKACCKLEPLVVIPPPYL